MHHFLCVRFEKFLFVLQTIKRSLEEGRRVNKRDVYYQEIYAFVIIDYFMNRLKHISFVYKGIWEFSRRPYFRRHLRLYDYSSISMHSITINIEFNFFESISIFK